MRATALFPGDYFSLKPEPQSRIDDIGRLIRKMGGGWGAFEVWRDEFHACLKEEFPGIAQKCALV